MFVNVSNHPSALWNEKQLNSACQYGEITDIPFPNVSPVAQKEEIEALAEKIMVKILSLNPDCVMCVGEFTLTYALVSRLKSRGIKTVAACAERKTTESVDEKGRSVKTSIMDFVCFREY